MSVITGFMEVIPIIPSIYTVVLYLGIAQIPRKWIQYAIPPAVALLICFLSPYFQEFQMFFWYTIIAVGVITLYPVFHPYYRLKWKLFFVFVTAFIAFFWTLLIAFVIMGGGDLPLLTAFPAISLLPRILIHYFEVVLLSAVIYSYFLILDRMIDYLGNELHDWYSRTRQ